MSVHKESTLFQDQKKTKPRIEDMIRELLDGNHQRTALDFVAYMRENRMPPTWASANSWKASYKNKGVCYIKIDRHGRNSWRINPITDHTEDYDAFTERENLRGIIVKNVAYCTRCHPNTCAPKGCADTFSGVRKAYWGKEMDGICRGGDTSFESPDETSIRCLKKMFAFKRQAIEGSAVPKVKYVAQKRRVSRTEVVVLAHDIKVVGLSLAKSALPKSIESPGTLWGMYTDGHRRHTRHVKLPIVGYGVSLMGQNAYDYVVGSEVTAFEEIPDEMVAVTIPAGRYIKDTFNAYDFDQLVTETLPGRELTVKRWAEENGVSITKPTMFIEAYPVQDMVQPAGEVTSENFRQDDRLKAKYPLMYTLLPIE